MLVCADVPFQFDAMPSFGLFPVLDLRKCAPQYICVESKLERNAPKQNEMTLRIWSFFVIALIFPNVANFALGKGPYPVRMMAPIPPLGVCIWWVPYITTMFILFLHVKIEGYPFTVSLRGVRVQGFEFLFVIEVTEVSPSRFVVCRRSGDRRAAI